MEQILDGLQQMLAIVNEMSPYLLLGFFFAGVMHAFIPGAVYSRYLAGNNFRSALYATLFGIPLPLCSCGVIPTAMSLRKEGASKGATVSFLIATPETGVDSIAATYSLMGLPFAIVRPITALITSVFAGSLVNACSKEDDASENESEDACEEESHCCFHSKAEKENPTFADKCKEVFEYAFVEMMGDIGKWLAIGLVIAGLITVFVPDSFFEIFKGNTLLSMLLVLCIAIPMYICATGSIPIAVALMMKGLTPGAALVLLMAGPACNMASLLVIGKRLGSKTLILYLISIITGAVLAGIVIDQMPSEWFMPTLMQTSCCAEETTSWFNILCTVVLVLLMLNVLIKQVRGEKTCCCHEEKEEEHCCCCHEEKEEEHCCCCHEEKEEEHHCCCCHDEKEEEHCCCHDNG